jgi:hypothetical protein
MTNANVDAVVEGTSGRDLKLSYKGGSNTVTVPANVPVVTFAPHRARQVRVLLFGGTHHHQVSKELSSETFDRYPERRQRFIVPTPYSPSADNSPACLE